MRVMTIVGARPQMIKALAISRVLRDRGDVHELLIHTGQHYDRQMSDIFFQELALPVPFANLAVQEQTHGKMTARMLERLEPIVAAEKPDVMLLYGDTNSTLAGALVAVKAGVPIAHVEAGVRTGDWAAPEESNRVVVDRLSTWAFCATHLNYDTLVAEGLGPVSHHVGDVMYDIALLMKDVARTRSRIAANLGVEGKRFVLGTCHRAETTDDRGTLAEVLGALATLAEQLPVVLPMHPRTAKQIEQFELGELVEKLIVTEPLGLLDMVALESAASAIITDSGGVQKEAFFHGVPCVIAFPNAVWPELVALGHNVVAGTRRDSIVCKTQAALAAPRLPAKENPFGDGRAADRIVDILLKSHAG